MSQQEQIGETMFSLLSWDSEHFGFPIGRVWPARLTPDLAEEAVAWAEKGGVKCLYFLADPSDPGLLGLAREWGFEFVDARLELQLDGLPGREERCPNSVGISVADERHLQSLEFIASESHGDTRFFRDTRFPVERVRELYRKWIRRDVEAGRVLIATEGGECLGYVSLSMSEGEGRASIGLIAVSDKARGRGVGGAMLDAALALAKERRLNRVAVVTQAGNISAQRLYQSAGFRSSSCEYWFHRWFE